MSVELSEHELFLRLSYLSGYGERYGADNALDLLDDVYSGVCGTCVVLVFMELLSNAPRDDPLDWFSFILSH
jgi:hypothetical protein